MPKHIVRLIVLFVVLGGFAVMVRNHLTDKSYYRYGYYRGDSVAEIAQDKPKYQGTAYCTSCHAAQSAEWSKSIHNSADIGKIVKCEVCHGPGGSRDPQKNFIKAATGPIHPANLKLAVPTDTRTMCSVCHEQIAGRPLQQRQIVIKDHAGTQQCTLCHNPHAPQTFIGSFAAPEHPGNVALGKAKIESCVACHGANGVSVGLPGPTLAGQNQSYLVAALTGYKAGKRNNPLMTPMAATVSDGDINDITAYFSSLKCKSALNAADQAAAVQKAGATMCVNCHGADGFGAGRGWPNLAGQSKDYLAATLKAYATGERSSVIMSAITKSMSDADMDNLAAYYAGASCK